jgi:three-Cys-motif partner protein
MAKKDSKSNMHEHSEVKVKLLGTYLERYLNILNNSAYVDEINYFDLFSAEGIYENGGEGSPIIVLKAIKKAYNIAKKRNGQSGKFNVLFNDIDPRKIEKLQQNIKDKKLHYPEIGEIEFKKEDYNDIFPQIVDSINKSGKREKAFIFIDPYGYKEIRISDIKAILQNKKSEVLLFLPTHFMFRFHENGTPESLIDFINELVPESKWPKRKRDWNLLKP